MNNPKDLSDDDWRRVRGTKPGGDLRVKLRLTSQEIANNVEKKIKINRQVVCKTCDGFGAQDKTSFQTCHICNGAGQVTKVTNTILGQLQTVSPCVKCHGTGSIILSKCKVCHGDGVVGGEEIVCVNIPAGLSEGTEFIIKGEGNAGPRGGSSGNLIIQIEEVSPETKQKLEKLTSNPDKNGKSYFEQIIGFIKSRKAGK